MLKKTGCELQPCEPFRNKCLLRIVSLKGKVSQICIKKAVLLENDLF